MNVTNVRNPNVSRGGSKQQEYRAEQGEAVAATLEERVFESEPVEVKAGRPRSSMDHPSLFTVDLLGGWCKP